jgi:trans-aconitate 2-methyltransferase
VTRARAGCHTLAVPADAWNPQQYERFHAEREQPFRDLLGLVQPRPDMRIVDLGCGTGELTREVHRSLAARETVGLDSSPAMLERSAPHAGGGLRFERGDIATFAERDACDLLFSNAALHWVPDHEALLARLTQALRAHGQLAVQVPANFDHPSHVTATEVGAELGLAPHPVNVLLPERYASALHRLGYGDQHVRLQVYAHRLRSREDVVEWVKGTLLTDYARRLEPEAFDEFLRRYRDRLLARLPDTRPFLFTFKRILFWARR